MFEYTCSRAALLRRVRMPTMIIGAMLNGSQRVYSGYQRIRISKKRDLKGDCS
jgi:hypothetical protein